MKNKLIKNNFLINYINTIQINGSVILTFEKIGYKFIYNSSYNNKFGLSEKVHTNTYYLQYMNTIKNIYTILWMELELIFIELIKFDFRKKTFSLSYYNDIFIITTNFIFLNFLVYNIIMFYKKKNNFTIFLNL